MQEWYILGATKGVLFRDVSSVQGCPYRSVPHYIQCEKNRLSVHG